MLLLFGVLIFFMFWSSRSQQKKQQKLLSDLKKGDRVVTQSGLLGKLAEVGDRIVKVEIAPGVKAEMLKSSLIGKDGSDAGNEKK